MAGTHPAPSARPGEKHVHHGRTPAAWVGSITALVAIVIGGIALVIPNWTLFWVSVGLLVAALIAVVVLRRMGHGAD